MLKLYNTLTQTKDIFKPLDDTNVRMYVCGPTVYDLIHIGNARAIVVFDLLYRVLKTIYPKVTYVRNITDIDDKIITRANELDIEINQLTQQTILDFNRDILSIKSLHPDFEPKATETIPEMIDIITRLIDKGYAYVNEGHVLFRVKSYKNYGMLSRRKEEEQIQGARVEVAPYKEYAGDFVLWKPSHDDQPGWDSPWGIGRPGWHIECSAMSSKYLGKVFDIHGGGQDLIFPHHENEIAQSCCAFDEDEVTPQLPFPLRLEDFGGQAEVSSIPLAHTWVHNGMVVVDNMKMSKSLGNFITLREAVNRYGGEVVRWFLLSAHYRQILNFTEKAMEDAKANLNRLYRALQSHFKPDWLKEKIEFTSHDILNPLYDDLNSPLTLSNIMGEVNNFYKAEASYEEAYDLFKAARVLGFCNETPENWFKGLSDWHPQQVSSDFEYILAESDPNSWIEIKIQERNAARANKDFGLSDKIRQELFDAGIVLEDTKEGTSWRKR